MDDVQDPNDAQDPAVTPSIYPLAVLPMPDDDRVRWKGDLDRAKRKIERLSGVWDINMAGYAPDTTIANWAETEVNPGVSFYTVEQKKAQLFYDTPTVLLSPEPDEDPAQKPAIHEQQIKLNRTIGPTKIDCKGLMDKVLFDILCPSGFGATTLGFTTATRMVPVPDPMNPQQPRLGPDGQPMTAPVSVYQECFWEHLSPKMLLVPAPFTDTDYDKAPWLGWRFRFPAPVGRRLLKLPPDFEPRRTSGSGQTDKMQTPGYTDSADDDDTVISGSWLEYKAAWYDDAEVHPQKLRELVFVDGIDEPVVHRDSPHQTFGENGQMSGASLVGFTTHVFTARGMTDSAFVPSDCTVQRPLVNELTKFRTQVIEHRDSSTSIRLANADVMTNEVLAKVTRGPYGSLIPIPGAAYDPSRPPVMEVVHPQYSRENFEGARVIENDLTKVSALGANQLSSRQEGGTSATESTYIQRSTDVRLNAERNRILKQFIAGVTKIDTLLQRYPEGPAQAAPLGRYAYSIKPDSGQHIDVAEKRKFALDRYNFFAKAPNVNQQYLMAETAPLLDLDPAQLFMPPQPPKPPEPKTSIIVKGEDVSPLAPQYGNMIEILNELGFKVTQQPITPDLVKNAAMSQPTPPPHPGAAPKADMVSKHHAEDGTGMQGLPVGLEPKGPV